MPGDYSRTTHDAAKHFSAVLMQQGRVQLDADWNEQRDVSIHFLRALAADLIGPHGGPGVGFKIAIATDSEGKPLPYDFAILPGHYYVEGLLCENDAEGPVRYSQQPDHAPQDDVLEAGHQYLVYLEAWEQEITALTDDSIREVALKGPDTAARLRILWQIRILDTQSDEFDQNNPEPFLRVRRPRLSTARLRARALADAASDEPCSLSPDARYRGSENQLYRVEVHRGGDVGSATFVWSRDNGAPAFAVISVHDRTVTLEDLGPDPGLSIATGDWVEIIDDDTPLDHRIANLLQVQDVDPLNRKVTLSAGLPAINADRHPILRRWDHGRTSDTDLVDGALPIREGDWIEVEDGIEIWFDKLDARYQPGDFWQIPARTATGDVDWPGPPADPESRPPQGIYRRVAPLCLINVAANEVSIVRPYRNTIQSLVTPD